MGVRLAAKVGVSALAVTEALPRGSGDAQSQRVGCGQACFCKAFALLPVAVAAGLRAGFRRCAGTHGA